MQPVKRQIERLTLEGNGQAHCRCQAPMMARGRVPEGLPAAPHATPAEICTYCKPASCNGSRSLATGSENQWDRLLTEFRRADQLTEAPARGDGVRRDDEQEEPLANDRLRIWLICQTYDDKGNVIVYEYKAEDSELDRYPAVRRISFSLCVTLRGP
jgi:hypothetical protein